MVRWIDRANDYDDWYLDIETTGLDRFKDSIVGLGWGVGGLQAYIPFHYGAYKNGMEWERALSHLGQAESYKHRKWFHNGVSFDIPFLSEHGWSLSGEFGDTYILSRLLNEHHGADLKGWVRDYLNIPAEDFKEAFPSARIWEAPLLNQAYYGCHDVEYLQLLKEYQMEHVKNAGLSKIVDLEFSLIPYISSMNIEGVAVDLDYYEKAKEKVTEVFHRAEKETALVWGEINLNSPKQVLVKLKDFGINVESTNAKIMKEYREESHEVDLLMKYKEIAKLKQAFVDKYADNFHDKNGFRVFPTFNQVGTETGRFSCREPNLQQLPKTKGAEFNLRGTFVPDEGHVMLAVDYSQQEMRIMAHLSKDEFLLKAYRENIDVHKLTASLIFNKPMERVSSLERTLAKSVGFGIIYGISEYGLARNIVDSDGKPLITVEDGKKFIDKYFKSIKGVDTFINTTKQFALDKGYTASMWGRKRRFPDLRVYKGKKYDFKYFKKEARGALRQAVNHVIQSTAADMTKAALLGIVQDNRLTQLGVRPRIQVHDELIFSIPKNNLDEARERVLDIMEHVMTLDIPLVAEATVYTRWGNSDEH